MHVNPHRRAAAARLLLDAVTALDLDDHTTEDADQRMLLALKPLGLDLDTSPKTAAAMAGAVDLLWFLTRKQAELADASQEEVVSNIRQHVLPQAYPDVYGDNG